MFDKCQISRSITDSMWRFDIEIDKDYPCPRLWEPVEATLVENNKKYCVFIGFPISKQKVVRDGDEYTRLSGVSYGWYVANRPLRPSERTLQSTQSGSNIIIEDPITYLNRLFFTGGNRLGLSKGYWDGSTTGWVQTNCPIISLNRTRIPRFRVYWMISAHIPDSSIWITGNKPGRIGNPFRIWLILQILIR